MTGDKLAFERLQRVNPQPVTHIGDRPDPRGIMRGARSDVPTLVPTAGRTRRSPRLGPLVSLAAFVVVLALGLPMLLDLDPEVTPADLGSPVARPVTTIGALTPGTYEIGALGVPLTIEVPFEWWVESIDPGRVVFQDPGGGVGQDQGAQRRQLTLVRPTALANPEDLSGNVPPDNGWPLDDIQGWLGNLEDGVSVSDVSQTSMSGYPTTRFTLRLDETFGCGPVVCGRFLSSKGSGDLALGRGSDWIVWWVDLGSDVEPLAFVATTADEDVFKESLEQLVASVVISEPGPHPLETNNVWELGIDASVPAGVVRTPAAGGIQFELPSDQVVFQSSYGLWVFPTGLTVLDLFVAEFGNEGETLETVEDVASYLESREDLTAVDVGAATLGPYSGRVYDITDGPVSNESALWVFGEPSYHEIPPPTFGRVWVANTERGALVLAAGTLEGDLGLESVLDFASEIVPTVELIASP